MFASEPCISVALEITPRPVKSIPKSMVLDGVVGRDHVVELSEVKGYYQFAGDAPMSTRPFKVDTGAAITVIRLEDWDCQSRRHRVRWLHEAGVAAQENGLPGKTYELGGVGGGRIAVYFGRVSLRFFRAQHGGVPAVDVSLIAAFDTTKGITTTLVGLGGEAFVGGGICLNGIDKSVHFLRL